MDFKSITRPSVGAGRLNGPMLQGVARITIVNNCKLCELSDETVVEEVVGLLGN